MISVPRHISDTNFVINPESIQSLRYWNGEIYEHVVIDSVVPGKGYWVISKDRKNIDLTRFPIVNSTENFALNVAEGWNMIGNPWSWNINLDSLQFTDLSGTSYILEEAVSRELVNAAFYLWNTKRDTQEYQVPNSNRIKINTGYWMHANQAGSIKFNPKPFVLDGFVEPIATFPKSVSNSDVIIRLKIKQGSMQDKANYFGICQDKSVYPLFYQDAFEAPPFNDNIRLYAQKEGQNLATNLIPYSDFDSVHVWNLFVDGNSAENNTILTWELSNNQSPLFFFLYNLESGKWINLKDHNSFDISSKKSNVPFKLYATTLENFTPELLPTKFSLSQNYPNPFNPSTSIKILIPYYADGIKATIDVFDVLGRKVKNILNRRVKSGEIVLSWKGINESGKKVSSGIYFYRLQAGDYLSSKKMILIR